ncbi:WecB/TagA/CpsF family glycosyltransferase [Candidatus Uhrbacteria bacterium]|nr:WecB/TagA/CpsF family glycosyltransferase [Candidatus Uhrbacteria bacterium]
MSNKSISILGVRVDCLTNGEVLQQCKEWLVADTGGHQIVTVNPEFVMEAQHNKQFREIINSAACSTADGVGLLFASSYVSGGACRLHRLTGVDLTMNLAELCSRNDKRLYLLGATGGVAEKVGMELKKLYPSLMIAGVEEGIKTGYSKDQSDNVLDQQICKRITDSQANVLLVAFGAPKQDLWISENLGKLPTVKIAVGVGGTFDYIARVVPRAPKWMRVIGFEWTYRLMTQPYRWRRIITAAVRFPLAVLFSKSTTLNSKL